jgi:hypothetical protein
MAEQSGAPRPALTTDEVRAFADRAPRCRVRIAVLCQQPGLPSFVETQLVNVSRSGMFLASRYLLDVGTTVEFQFSVDADVVVLRGTAEVVRLAESGERGMGMRFTALDEAGLQLIDRIVAVSSHEPPLPGEAAPAAGDEPPLVAYDHGSLRIVLTDLTAAYFTYNPLLHIGIAGCFVPADGDVPLGTGYQLDIVEPGGRLVLRCKAKVAAKQERRLGLRLVDVDRTALRDLRARITQLLPS